MNLEKLFNKNLIELNFTAESKENVLREIARLIVKNNLVKKYTENEIFSELNEREKLSSTGLGNSIAIPHCTLKGITEFLIGVITLNPPIDFESIDDKKVELVMFVIAPANERSEYIRILSKISGVLKNPQNVKELLSSKTPEILKENFLKNLEFIPDKQKRREFVQIDVIIQNEDLFSDILQKFTEIEESSIVVLDADNAGYYLYSSPLFANLWSDNEKKFNKMIIAVVPKNVVNELIRNFEEELKNIKNGVLITMHNIIYSSGSLEI